MYDVYTITTRYSMVVDKRYYDVSKRHSSILFCIHKKGLQMHRIMAAPSIKGMLFANYGAIDYAC